MVKLVQNVSLIFSYHQGIYCLQSWLGKVQRAMGRCTNQMNDNTGKFAYSITSNE